MNEYAHTGTHTYTRAGVPYFASMGHAGLGIGQSLSSSFTGNKSAYEYHLGLSFALSLSLSAWLRVCLRVSKG